MELGFNSDLIKKWRRMIKREAAKNGESFNPSTTLEVQFLRNLIEEFLEVVICTSLFL
jgi:intron-binding protein aquarius